MFGSTIIKFSFEDEYVEYKDKPTMISDFIFCTNDYPFKTWEIGDYIEIDNDKTRYKSIYDVFDDTDIVRKFGSSLTSTRNAMISASSANPTALAITRDLADRVDRGEETQFTYQIEDNGVKHSWIYKRN